MKMIAIRFHCSEESFLPIKLWEKTLNRLLESKRISFIEYHKGGRFYCFPDTYPLDKIAEEIYLLIEPMLQIEPYCCSPEIVTLHVSASDYSSYAVYPLMDIYKNPL